MSIDPKVLLNESETRMAQSIDVLKAEMSKFRTGRAHTGLIDGLQVEVYGSMMPLGQVASITVEGPQSLLVVPWDKSQVASIEKAIHESELGLNPATQGDQIRVPLPALTQERRDALRKLVGQEAEKTKVAVRNIRRDALQSIKSAVKDKILTEDVEYAFQADIQKMTDKMTGVIDTARQAKEKELQQI